MADGTTIRGYRADDRDACRALWVELTAWHRRIYGDDSIGGDDPAHFFDEHLERVGPENVWIAERDRRVVGFAGLIVEAPSSELEPVVVSESQRGSGIGRALVETVVAEARTRGLRRVQVRPAARNAEALRFFHACGFDVLGQLELTFDLARPERWRPGERLAGRDFRV
jgi:N-acetylglutamate synthase-like GNAT family acetyltransferase